MSDSRVTRTVCVSNLAPAVNEQVLRDFFEYHGAISNIKISSGDPMVASSNRYVSRYGCNYSFLFISR